MSGSATESHAGGVRFAAPAVLPGTDLASRTSALEAELDAPHAGTIAELPARGHYTTVLGRAIGQLHELHGELTSYGWRLTARPGADRQRAAQGLRGDVDTVADVRGERLSGGHGAADLSYRVLGPLSLAASLALPSGEKVLVDHGARRDLADSLGAGVRETVERIRRTCRPERLSVVVEEPRYGSVLDGTIPTVSGYRTIRSIPRDEARTLLAATVAAARAGGADEVYLDTGSPVTTTLAQDHASARPAGREHGPGEISDAVDGFGLPAPGGEDLRRWELLAELSETGLRFLVPVLRAPAAPAADPGSAALPEASELAERLSRPWRDVGMGLSSLSAMTLTTHSLGSRDHLSGVSPARAMAVITRVHAAAEALTDQMRS